MGDITITLDEFERICQDAQIVPTHAVNRERKGREGVVFTMLRFLTTDEGLRAPQRFLIAAGRVLDLDRAMFVADSIGWSRGAVTEINLADVIVEGISTRRA
jgi:hypothetical protein